MRDKLRQLDETYLDLVIGILLCGVLSAILGMIITRGDLRYLIGAIVGTIFALVMIKLSMSAFIAALVGFLSSKFAAFLQKPIHEHITRRVLQE